MHYTGLRTLYELQTKLIWKIDVLSRAFVDTFLAIIVNWCSILVIVQLLYVDPMSLLLFSRVITHPLYIIYCVTSLYNHLPLLTPLFAGIGKENPDAR